MTPGAPAAVSVGLPLGLGGHALGIIALSILWGLAQERVGATHYCDEATGACERFSAIPVMALVQALVAAALSLAASAALRERRVGSFTDLLPASLSHTVASPIGYLAMRFMPYPLFVLVSSCKLIPVLGVGLLVNRGTRRPAQDFVSALMMTQGVVLYSYAQAAHGPGGGGGAKLHDAWGVALSAGGMVAVGICLTLTNLVLEGYTNAAQDALLRRARAAGRAPTPPLQMQFDMNAWSVLLLTAALAAECAVRRAAAQSMLLSAAAFAWRHPEVLRHILVFAGTGAVAQVFIFSAIARFGGFTTTCVTVTRKVFSVLLSVLVFGHAIGVVQVVAIANVFAGLSLQLLCGATHELCVRPRPHAELLAAHHHLHAHAAAPPAAEAAEAGGAAGGAGARGEAAAAAVGGAAARGGSAKRVAALAAAAAAAAADAAAAAAAALDRGPRLRRGSRTVVAAVTKRI